MKTTKKIAAAITISLGLSISAAPIMAADPEFYGKVENYTWKEFSSSGTQLLKESGPVYTFGLKTTHKLEDSTKFNTKAEIFMGSVNYDGSTWGGTPITSKSNYHGIKLEGDWATKLSDKENAPETFWGVGYKWWTRSLDSTLSSIGYTEYWSSVYGKAGIRQSNNKGYYEVGVKAPIVNNNHVPFVNTSVKPGNNLGYYAEIGVDKKDTKIALSYDYQKYSQSDAVNGIIQPKSETSSVGLSATFKF